MTDERHLLMANTHLLALLVMYLEESDIMAVKDFASRVETTLDVVPEGPGRDYLRNFAGALRAREPFRAFPPSLRLSRAGGRARQRSLTTWSTGPGTKRSSLISRPHGCTPTGSATVARQRPRR